MAIDNMGTSAASAKMMKDTDHEMKTASSDYAEEASGDMDSSSELDAFAIPEKMVTNKFQRMANKFQRITGAEARGIERVDESLRTGFNTARDWIHMTTIWFSVNLTANILTIGVLGPIAFGLGCIDAMVCCLFGTIIGSVATCYMATFGALSGTRTLVTARHTMGWWPTKICVLCALVVILGYGLVDAVVTGLIFSAVSGGSLSSIVGIVIFGLIVWFFSSFGIKYFNMFERYAYIPQVCILFSLIGCAAPFFDTTTKSQATGSALAGARLSYLFVCASGPLGWSPFVADYFVYHPKTSNRWGVFGFTLLGFMASKIFVEFIGIGLGSGLMKNPTWAVGFTGNNVGGLIVAAYEPLGAYGKFCAVMMGIGITANMIPGNYSAAFCVQLLSSRSERVPRIVWNSIATLVYIICAIAGRTKLLTIFLNFLPLIGYWTIIFITLTFEEEFLFRRPSSPFKFLNGYKWEDWNDRQKLPIGIAAFTTFLIGWVGAILCMSQVYYTGPIAKMIPGDIGLPVAAAWTALVYPGLRWLELKKFGR